jgi:hypothetical protein
MTIYINKMSKCAWELVQLSFCLSGCLSVYLLCVWFKTSHAFPFLLFNIPISKQFHYRPRQTVRVPGVWGSQISRQTEHGSSKVVSPRHRPPLLPGNIPVLISVRGWVNLRAIVKNSNGTIGNRTRDHPACGAVPQPTAPPCTPKYQLVHVLISTSQWYTPRFPPPPKKKIKPAVQTA